MKSIKVDLSQDPGDRWMLSERDAAAAGRLMDRCAMDIGGLEQHRDMLEAYDLSGCVAWAYRAEMNATAIAIDRPYLQVLLGNVYYDALKLVLGSGNAGFACSAYARRLARRPGTRAKP